MSALGIQTSPIMKRAVERDAITSAGTSQNRGLNLGLNVNMNALGVQSSPDMAASSAASITPKVNSLFLFDIFQEWSLLLFS